MSHIRLYMPRGGEDGVIIAWDEHRRCVEFRGPPYSQWHPNTSPDSPFYRLYSSLRTVNISDLHNGELQTITPWNEEYPFVRCLFVIALHEVAQ
jgi:hypothetical protein